MADKREPKLDISLYGTRQCPAEVELITSTGRGMDDAQKSLVLGEADGASIACGVVLGNAVKIRMFSRRFRGAKGRGRTVLGDSSLAAAHCV